MRLVYRPETMHQRHELNIEQGLLMKRLAGSRKRHQPLHVTGGADGGHYASAVALN